MAATGLKLVGFLGEDQNDLQATWRLLKAGNNLKSGNIKGAVGSLMKGSDPPAQRLQTLLGTRKAQFDGLIRVKVFSAKGLANLDKPSFFSKGGSDPYVNVKVDGVNKGKTKVASNAQEPGKL